METIVPVFWRSWRLFFLLGPVRIKLSYGQDDMGIIQDSSGEQDYR